MRFSIWISASQSWSDILATAQHAEATGWDGVWVADHFMGSGGPVFPPETPMLEAGSLVAALAAAVPRVRIGTLVYGNTYRHPAVVANMAATVDHVSDGRFTLGIGSGWFERDYTEYGYEFGTAIERLHKLRDDLPVIKERLGKLTPQPLGRLPILVGGSGEKVTLRLVAEHADGWNSFGPADSYAKKNAILDEWCAKVGRDPAEIERTIAISPGDVERWESFVAAGATHLIVMTGDPFALDAVAHLQELVAG